MDVEKAIEIIDAALQEKPLNKFEKMVLRQCWEGRSYEEISTSSGYNVGHIKNVGSQLWKKLSLGFGERVSQSGKETKRDVIRVAIASIKIAGIWGNKYYKFTNSGLRSQNQFHKKIAEEETMGLVKMKLSIS